MPAHVSLKERENRGSASLCTSNEPGTKKEEKEEERGPKSYTPCEDPHYVIRPPILITLLSLPLHIFTGLLPGRQRP